MHLFASVDFSHDFIVLSECCNEVFIWQGVIWWENLSILRIMRRVRYVGKQSVNLRQLEVWFASD